MSPRAITRSNTRSSNMAAATQGVPSSSDRLTDIGTLIGGLNVTADRHGIHGTCASPSANRYPYCGCGGCLVAYRIKKRARRRAQSEGAYVCQCGHRFATINGLRVHRGKVHGYERAVAA